MPTINHQTLVLWIARKMTTDGFRVVAMDGVCQQGGCLNNAPRPIEIYGIRPDVFGMNADGLYAFGEAKTERDINCAHTRHQLSILSRCQINDSSCRLYIGVKRSSALALDKVLSDLGLIGDRNIVRLHIPDILIGSHEAV